MQTIYLRRRNSLHIWSVSQGPDTPERVSTCNISLLKFRENDHPDNADHDDTTWVVSYLCIRLFFEETYKPAKVKRIVKTICCLTVVRSRHKSGIGYQDVNIRCPTWRNTIGTYYYEDQTVETNIGRAAANEEVINVEAVALNAFIDSIPGVVEWATASFRLSCSSTDAGPTYHCSIMVRSIATI